MARELGNGDVVQLVMGHSESFIYERHAYGGGDGPPIALMKAGDIGIVVESFAMVGNAQLAQVHTKHGVGWRRWVINGRYKELEIISKNRANDGLTMV